VAGLGVHGHVDDGISTAFREDIKKLNLSFSQAFANVWDLHYLVF
jgi:hypothetical protein